MSFPIENPRDVSRRIVRESVDAELWSKNEAFTQQLDRTIKASRLFNHPVIASFAQKEFTLKSMGIVHSEVRYAFAEHFGDALIRLMETTSSLERRLGAKPKMAARFLIMLNVLEEVGYKPTPRGKSGFCGHPGFSHYWQLVDTLTAVGHPEETWAAYTPSPEAVAVRKSLLDSFGDHLRLAVVLAGIETAFIPYYGPWADNTLAVCPTDISDGYHSIHVEADDGTVVDHDHSEDSWFIVRQALTPDRYAEIEAFLNDVVEEWARFVDMLAAKDRDVKRAA
ncbi:MULTISPECIES: hypothetical protein [Corallococcus]|uniref:hypothetical protein n=1 Tax=Corallococcus TaxID=83461 RepID=UPI00117FFD8C|nr:MULTISPECIES: hypothetical protein [Corallococcus]NBD10813.1 hypothetical protein [Corallococcus silvisoli]TSC31743.1 hypothetical protein FOF48_13915 [Corallococcus sp. Z5C101001]